MKNQFGQDINPGDIVGLGIRSGNTSEQRVGIVLELMIYASRPHDNCGLCAWYNTERTVDKWSERDPETGRATPLEYRDVHPGKVMISKQMFRFFKLDPSTINHTILDHLNAAYSKHIGEVI
jgi:hypothetical protein